MDDGVVTLTVLKKTMSRSLIFVGFPSEPATIKFLCNSMREVLSIVCNDEEELTMKLILGVCVIAWCDTEFQRVKDGSRRT